MFWLGSGADPGFVERAGAVATTSAAGAKVFGGSRLKTLFGISKGGRAPPAPPPLNPLVRIMIFAVHIHTLPYMGYTQ